MAKFLIEIEERLQRIENVEAESLEKAINIVKENYNSEKIILDYGDFVGYKIREHSGIKGRNDNL